MDTLTTFAIVAMLAALAGTAASLASLVGWVIVPALVRRHHMRALAAEVQHLAERHAQRRPPRRRHGAHCPACGRFARVTSTGPRGTWTRCTAHGIRLRATRRIGRGERGLVEVSTHRPLVALPLPAAPSLAWAAPARLPDWLDASPALAPARLRRAA